MSLQYGRRNNRLTNAVGTDLMGVARLGGGPCNMGVTAIAFSLDIIIESSHKKRGLTE